MLKSLILLALTTGITSALVIYPKALERLKRENISCTYTDTPIAGWFIWLIYSVLAFPLILALLLLEDKEELFIDKLVAASRD